MVHSVAYNIADPAPTYDVKQQNSYLRRMAYYIDNPAPTCDVSNPAPTCDVSFGGACVISSRTAT